MDAHLPGTRVFICSPYRGSTPEEQERHVSQAREMLGWAVRQGCAPFAPHLLYPGALDDAIEAERNQGIAAGMNFLLACHELWWLDSPKGVTTGMGFELKAASQAGVRIYRAARDSHGFFFPEEGVDLSWAGR